MPTRRELFQKTAKLAWTAPMLTAFPELNPGSLAFHQYYGYLVRKTSPEQKYSDFCNADCHKWFEDTGNTLREIEAEVGQIWWYRTRLFKRLFE